MAPSISDPWSITEQHFVGDSTLADKLRFALRYATLAPSSHNTQPWHFIVDYDQILVCADRARMLAISDPFGRELTISCGAALFNLRVALSQFLLPYAIHLFPTQTDPNVLAKVRITTSGFADPALRALLPAITRRVTTRTRFADTPVPKALCQELAQAAATEGAQARCIGECTVRERIAELIAPGRACVHDALRWLGVELDADVNRADGPRISGEASRVSVWVVLTDEKLMIA